MRRALLVLAFLAALGLGVIGTVFAPRVLGPYLPRAIRGMAEPVEGTVVAKQREPERLLLTILTPQGALLATFKEKVAETTLLVEVGDSVTLALRAYEPFVENPVITKVIKQGAEGTNEPSAPSAPSKPRQGVDEKASQ